MRIHNPTIRNPKSAFRNSFIDSEVARHYKDDMRRRLATLLLAVAVILTGITACPRGGACAVMQQAAHKCCHHSVTFRSSNCCDTGNQLAQRALGTERCVEHGKMPLALTAVLSADMQASAPLAITGVEITRGLAPPGTLITQHTSLLL